MSVISLDAYGISDVGIVKNINEDSFVYKVAVVSGYTVGLFAIADGVGGLAHGEDASQICIRRINQWWESELNGYNNSQTEIDIDSLREAIIDSNTRILRKSTEDGFRSGTTLTVLVTLDNRAVIAHVGDSRCYRLHRNFLWHFDRLTTDHSCEKTKLVDGVTVKKSVLTDCIGFRQSFRLDIFEFEICDGDCFILCSDGIYKTQSDSEIEGIIRHSKSSVGSICEKLVDSSKKNKETDNISVIAVSVSSHKG